jgi:hypothetical protein
MNFAEKDGRGALVRPSGCAERQTCRLCDIRNRSKCFLATSHGLAFRVVRSPQLTSTEWQWKHLPMEPSSTEVVGSGSGGCLPDDFGGKGESDAKFHNASASLRPHGRQSIIRLSAPPPTRCGRGHFRRSRRVTERPK